MLAKRTIPALAVAVALLGFIWFVERKVPTTDQAKEKAARLVDVESESVTRIESKPGAVEGESWTLVRASAGWRLDAPVKQPADIGLVGGVVADLSRIEIESRLPEPVDRKAYGLDPPQRIVTVTSADSKVVLRIGRDVPGFEAVAVELEGRDGSWAVRRGTGVAAGRRVEELRTKEIFQEPLVDVARIEIRSPGEPVGRVLEKRGAEWWTTEPGQPEDLSDVGIVEGFKDALAGAKVETFGGVPPTPESSWEIALMGKSGETRFRLEPPGGLTGPPSGRSRVSIGGESMQILSTFPKGLPSDARSPIAAAGRSFQPTKVVLSHGSASREFDSIDAGSVWKTAGGTVPSEAVMKVIDHLRTASAERRLSAEALAKGGPARLTPDRVIEVSEAGAEGPHRFEFIRGDQGAWGIWYRRRPNLVVFSGKSFAPILADLDSLEAVVPTPPPSPSSVPSSSAAVPPKPAR